MSSKPTIWLGSTKEDLREASDVVRDTMGAAIRAAQDGTKSDDAKPMKGELKDVMEVIEDDEGGTYRCMYTVKIGESVYVLDFFKKKSKTGIATPKADIDRVLERLKTAKRHHLETTREKQ